MESDRENNDSGNVEEETKTKEVNVRCSILLLHTSVFAGYLLPYYPDTVVTYTGFSLFSRQRFDMHDGTTVISVDWFGAGRTLRGERWDFDLLESWTKLRVVRRGSR